MRSWASRSGTPPRRATATATRTSRPAGRPSWTPSYSRSDRASTPGASWASRGAEKPNEPASASRRTSGLPPGSRRRSRSSWTTRSGAALAGHLTQSRCSSQGASVSTPLRRAPAWDEQRASRGAVGSRLRRWQSDSAAKLIIRACSRVLAARCPRLSVMAALVRCRGATRSRSQRWPRAGRRPDVAGARPSDDRGRVASGLRRRRRGLLSRGRGFRPWPDRG